jgi:hypothetical protein
MEVFQVMPIPQARIATSNGKQAKRRGNKAKDASPAMKHVTKFSDGINEAMNKKHACLLRDESEMLQLEESFKDEQTFIDKFASGDTKDVVALNVSGTIMVTMRSTLRTVAEDSVLAQQFDDSMWTEQGCNAPRVNEWTPDEVSTWAKSIGGIPEEVNSMLYENEITGEFLALTRDDLKMMGTKRVGNVALLSKEIEKLEKASRDIATLIKHSPYCFGKMLDYLRSKQLHSQGLLEKEPALPKVCDSQKKRFEKVVK